MGTPLPDAKGVADLREGVVEDGVDFCGAKPNLVVDRYVNTILVHRLMAKRQYLHH